MATLLAWRHVREVDARISCFVMSLCLCVPRGNSAPWVIETTDTRGDGSQPSGFRNRHCSAAVCNCSLRSRAQRTPHADLSEISYIEFEFAKQRDHVSSPIIIMASVVALDHDRD